MDSPGLLKVEVQAPVIKAHDQWGELATTLVVDDDDTAEYAAGDLNALQAEIKGMEGTLKSITDPIRALEQKARDLFRPGLEARRQAEALIKRKLGEYADKKRRAIEDQRRAEEAARRQEQERLAREAAAAASRANEEAAKLQKEADEEVAKGNLGAAAALSAQAQQVEASGAAESQNLAVQAQTMPVAVQTASASIKGVQVREKWGWEITDMKALCAAIAAGTVPAAAVEPAKSVLDKQASSLKDQLNWPGVRVTRDTNIAGSRRK